MHRSASFCVLGAWAFFCSWASYATNPPTCNGTVATAGNATAYPREIDPAKTFEALVQWIHDDLIVHRGAPGLVVGISGTDSIVTFLAAARAFERAGKPHRVAGVHYAPSEEFVDDNPNAAEHLWFQEKVIPWLKTQAPHAQYVVDTSIDWRRDGLRWGALMDWSVIADPVKRTMRPRAEQFWVLGTRNATEEVLGTYSNISIAASAQPLRHLWKSEILRISKFLNVPEVALAKSCEVDCVCGRMRLPAIHIPEVDALLMTKLGTLSPSYVERNMPPELRAQLLAFIDPQIATAEFKRAIPYVPSPAVAHVESGVHFSRVDEVLKQLAEGITDLRVLTRLVPIILAKGQNNIAASLVSAPSPNRAEWLPEALTLFNTPNLVASQKRQMIQAVFGGKAPNQGGGALAKVNARLGNYGFRFPQWRFLTQNAGGHALAEQFGLFPLPRATDLRNANLDRSDRDHDELGLGFVLTKGEWHVDYRRAYVAVSRLNGAPATLIIRNNSHYFGRDRLKNAVYVSFEKLTPAEIDALTAETLETSGRFVRWQNVFDAPTIPVAEIDQRVSELLNHLDQLNQRFDVWLKGDGRGAMADFLAQKTATPSVYLAEVDDDAPSWTPRSSTLVDTALVRRLRANDPKDPVLPAGTGRGRWVMMSGAQGDLP